MFGRSEDKMRRDSRRMGKIIAEQKNIPIFDDTAEARHEANRKWGIPHPFPVEGVPFEICPAIYVDHYNKAVAMRIPEPPESPDIQG